MLVITRKEEQQIVIGTDIVLRVLKVRDGRVRIGIEAPAETKIMRREIMDDRKMMDDDEEIRHEKAARFMRVDVGDE